MRTLQHYKKMKTNFDSEVGHFIVIAELLAVVDLLATENGTHL